MSVSYVKVCVCVYVGGERLCSIDIKVGGDRRVMLSKRRARVVVVVQCLCVSAVLLR